MPQYIIELAGGLLLGLILRFVSQLIVRFSYRKRAPQLFSVLKKQLRLVSLFLFPNLVIFIFFSMEGGAECPICLKISQVVLIFTGSWFLIKSANVVEYLILRKFDIEKYDNVRERRIVTQLRYLKKIVIVGIIIVAVSLLLLSFESGRKFGTALITSAGLLSLILGFASQKTLGNLIAGFQIAFTQPIKIDDAVLVENEWGWIEEINLTYVVVRIWDWRRLVLPITYFIEKPFQNWTRNEAAIIGSVYIYADYRLPVEKLREKLREILETEEKWDKNVWSMQVIDVSQETMTVRALMSASTSPRAWDLRCSVREQLLGFISENYPDYLPQTRVLMNKQEENAGNGNSD
ncbi:MAG: mechanosensitive ion channel family protein [Candidatus Kapaibacterium sp.]